MILVNEKEMYVMSIGPSTVVAACVIQYVLFLRTHSAWRGLAKWGRIEKGVGE